MHFGSSIDNKVPEREQTLEPKTISIVVCGLVFLHQYRDASRKNVTVCKIVSAKDKLPVRFFWWRVGVGEGGEGGCGGHSQESMHFSSTKALTVY